MPAKHNRFESNRKNPGARRKPDRSRAGRDHWNRAADDFKCAHCQAYVSADPRLSGVQSRNHCPYCLWSRHVDLSTAGDRLASCQARMQPIGLTLKKTYKKYARENSGELMLIHHCTGCEKISINRIAADDNTAVLLEVFKGSFELDPPTRARLEADGIVLLQAADAPIVHTRLFGQGSDPSEPPAGE